MDRICISAMSPFYIFLPKLVPKRLIPPKDLLNNSYWISLLARIPEISFKVLFFRDYFLLVIGLYIGHWDLRSIVYVLVKTMNFKWLPGLKWKDRVTLIVTLTHLLRQIKIWYIGRVADVLEENSDYFFLSLISLIGFKRR